MRRGTLSGLGFRHKAFTAVAWCCRVLELHTRLVSACALGPSFMWATGYPLFLLSHTCNCRLVVDSACRPAADAGLRHRWLPPQGHRCGHQGRRQSTEPTSFTHDGLFAEL